MILRQALQAKIDAAQAQVNALNAELSTAELTFADWVDQEAEDIKAKTASFMAKLAEHLG
jgi:flagellar biosynthesis regulator FlaF